MSLCPCLSGKEYDACCGPILSGAVTAPTAEALMRSRYSAFVRRETGYLADSVHPEHRADYDPVAVQRWADHSEWVKLEILNTSGGGPDDQEGTVEFLATYRQKGATHVHHEVGQFLRHAGRWYYTDMKITKPVTVRNEGPKIGRNDPCPCGSGKKYKKCCG